MQSREQILSTEYGEMLDLIDCNSIYEGSAVPKKKELTQEEIWLSLR